VIERPASKPSFGVLPDKNNLIISTSKIKATVSLSTGQVIFSDMNDNVILKEPAKGGSSFSSVTVEGTDGFKMTQVFESPDDEALYGLGQHQSDEFNYKGLNEVLYQYNTKVSVPFIVSNKNYGLLWDNYSMTWFGDPREYSNLDLFGLFDANGEEGGLTATYFDKSDSGKIYLQRKESSIDYYFIYGNITLKHHG
jgi:alpha-D-xyloside xylohydrolase